MVKYSTILLFLWAGITTAYSQPSNIPNAFLDRLDAAETYYYQDDDHNKAYQLLDSLLDSPTANENSEARARVLSKYATFYNEEGNYAQAVISANEAIEILNPQTNLLSLAETHQTLGVSYDYLGFYPKAIENILIALKYYEAVQDTMGMNNCHNNLANIQLALDEYDDAKRNYFRSLRFAEALNDSAGLGIAYINIGGLYLVDQNYDSARYFIKKAMYLAEAYEDELTKIYAPGVYSDFYYDLGQLDSAIYYQKISYALSKEYGSAYELANEELNLANIYLTGNRLAEARETSLHSLELSLKNGIKEIIHQSYDNLFYIDSINGNYKQSLYFYQQSQLYADSVKNEEVAKSAVRQQLLFNFEKKEAIAQLELDRRQRQRNLFIAGFFLMSIASGTILMQRNRISKERDRSENLLLNILPYETAQELKQKGYADSKHIDQVTVLFTDFKGFTQLSEKLPPEELVKNIHECFSAFDTIMEKHNVEKIKTIGDAYMAAGGLPTPNKSHAVEVVRAALDIQKFMAERISEKQKSGKPFFEIRIGVHTGPVVAGIVGIKKFQYDIWGDTVNTASRMESSGEVGKVNISGFTHSMVKEYFTCQYRGEVEAKGKGKIGMYFVDRKEV